MSALSKAMMAESLCEKFNLSKPDSRHMVDIFFEELRLMLEQGQNVKLSSFGNFTLRDKGQRPGRNPKTGEIVAVVARRVVTFKPGMTLKMKMQARLLEE